MGLGSSVWTAAATDVGVGGCLVGTDPGSSHLATHPPPDSGLKATTPLADVLRVKVLALRRAGACAHCDTALAVGTRAAWSSESRQVRCLPCADLQQAALVDRPSTPTAPVDAARSAVVHGGGVSAQNEYNRRSARREQQIRSQHPRLGNLLVALTQDPTSTRVWAQGAAGERAVAARLDALTGDQVLALHDRRLRRPDGTLSRANIDHLAVTGTGVWVIDAKSHQGALEVRRAGGLFSPRTENLYINGRDRTPLVHGLLKQVDAVRRELDSAHVAVPVRGALCFVGTELPWLGNSRIVDVPLVGLRGLAKLLRVDGELTAAERADVAAILDERFPPAA